MRAFVYQLVDRLADPDSGLSRNRHLALFSTPAGARALRLHRRLSGLSNELARHYDASRLSLTPHPTGVELRLEIPPIKFSRTSLLSQDDVAVLLKHEGPLPEALRRWIDEHGGLRHLQPSPPVPSLPPRSPTQSSDPRGYPSLDPIDSRESSES